MVYYTSIVYYTYIDLHKQVVLRDRGHVVLGEIRHSHEHKLVGRYPKHSGNIVMERCPQHSHPLLF